MRQLVVVGDITPTNVALLAAFRDIGQRTSLLPASALTAPTVAGDVYLGRLGVTRSLGGIEEGLEELRELERRGTRVLNPPAALFRSCDKLSTALALHNAGVPHPQTELVDVDAAQPPFGPPYVVKPRFGNRGRDVVMCENWQQLKRTLSMLSARPWFRASGALVQEFVPGGGLDLRVVVAGHRVVGAVVRKGTQGHQRTDISGGGERWPVVPASEAASLALGRGGSRLGRHRRLVQRDRSRHIRRLRRQVLAARRCD
jgi:ribosomal protein S6--L-glutamate ligase